MLESWNHPEYLKNIMSDILHEATLHGASSAEVDLSVNKGFTVVSRMREVESVEYHQDKIIEITVYFGKRTGSASLSDLRPEAIRSAVQAACNIARFTDEDECAGLAEKELLAFDYQNVDLFHPWKISVEQAIELARECEIKALDSDKRLVNSEGASLTTGEAYFMYGNTEGFIGACPGTRHEMSCVLIAKKGEEMQRDYGYTISCDPNLLQSSGWVAEQAAERALRRLGARSLTTRRVPVIFAADEARNLLGHFVGAISGGNLYRKSSFLVDQLGQAVFPKHISMDERPHIPKGLGSSPFDENGVRTRNNKFITDGILTSYVLSVYSARKLGMQTTGNAGGIHNLFVTTGQKDLAQLLKTMDTGLLVTDLLGNGVNILTGDYSRGAFGFWVEKGEIQYPVEEITIAGNLKDMYAEIVEIGNDIDKRGNIQTGSILIENMTVAGN